MASSRTSSLRVGLLLLLAGCLPEITLPECDVLTDCPVCEGWTQCRDGYCFKFDGTPGWDRFECGEICLESDHVAADGCCPGRSLEAETDPDCRLTSVDVSGAERLSRPAIFEDQVVIVSEGGDGALSVVRLTSAGVASEVSLSTKSATPSNERPVMMPDGSSLVASATGLCRAGESEVVWPCDRGAAPTLAPVVAGGSRVANIAQDTLQILDGAGSVIDEAAPGGAILGVAATESRWYVTTDQGLFAFDIEGELATPAWTDTALGPATPPSVDADGTVLFGDESGRLVGLTDTGAGFTVVSQDLPGAVYSQVTTNGQGQGCALTADGEISLLEVGPTPGRVISAGDTSGVTAPGVWTSSSRLYLTAPGRVIAYAPTAAGGAQIFNFRYDGLTAAPATLTKDHELVVTTSSSVVFLSVEAGALSTGWAAPDYSTVR